MGKPAVPLRYKLITLCAAALLACGLAPLTAFAEDSEPADASVSVAVGSAPTASEGSGEGATPNSSISAANEGSVLASSLVGSASAVVSADVMLDAAEPVVGSFTVDGLTYSVGPDGLTLVAVDVSAVAEDDSIAIPTTVTYADMEYPVTAIAPYAFYLSGATDVTLPASVASVDDRAFRSSDVGSVSVEAGNPNYASFDGALYSADKTRLLLIPEGRKGSVLLSCETEVVEPSKFSHCSLVDAISVEEGGAAFSSWDGLLYDASGQTLLRVPAGVAEITIHDGCTTIAAGALEGCANLERINAPASVTSISPDVFSSVPTVSLPAASAAGSAASDNAEVQMASHDEETSDAASGSPDQASDSAPQLTAMVALISADDYFRIDQSSIEVSLYEDVDVSAWQDVGFRHVGYAVDPGLPQMDFLSLQSARGFRSIGTMYFFAPGCRITSTLPQHGSGGSDVWSLSGDSRVDVSGRWVNVHWGTPYTITFTPPEGCTLAFWSTSSTGVGGSSFLNYTFTSGSWNLYAIYDVATKWNPNGGVWGDTGLTDERSSIHRAYTVQKGCNGSQTPERPGYAFKGWSKQPVAESGLMEVTIENKAPDTFYAQWEPYEIDFDVDSEPGDVDYPGDKKDPVSGESAGVDDTIAIEDPKRPGYVFEGWVIPSAGGTEAVDQELVYQDSDGKWYVDASKLPDYAGDDGRVELTARWTSVISVDVPQSVTFYADTMTQGQQSREGAVSSAFGQNKVANQSEVDLRVVGLESSAVKTDGNILGADSILKKADAAAPSTSAGKLLSLYPSTKQWTADELQDPDAVGGAKDANAVDFDLDDILLEKSFNADTFTIEAGKTLNMGYRLNLTETGQQLDYDKLSTLEDGQSAALANVSYCFAADALPSDWGEPLWVENPDRSLNPAKYLLLDDIKEAADDLSVNGTTSKYYDLYKGLLDAQVMSNGNPGAGPYFQLRVDGAYLPLQLIGICQDTKTVGGKAGLTFQMRDVYAYDHVRSDAAGGGEFLTEMDHGNTNSGGWKAMDMRERLSGKGSDGGESGLSSTFWEYLDPALQKAIVPVDKYHQLYQGETDETTGISLQLTRNETIWLPSSYEVFGMAFPQYNSNEGDEVVGYEPFQYHAYQSAGAGEVNVNAVKRFNGSAIFWWVRSPLSSKDDRFSYVGPGGRALDFSYARGFAGVAPCFCL